MNADIIEIIRSQTITNTLGFRADLVEPAVDAALSAGLVDGDTFGHGPVTVEIRGAVAIGTAPDGRTRELAITDGNRDALLRSKAIAAGMGANNNR